MTLNERLRSKTLARAISIALGGCLAAVPAAQGSDLPDISAFANAAEVSDDILGDTRGKFVTGSRFVQFGIEMASMWRDPTGAVLTAAANLNVDMSNNMPQATFVPNFTVVDAQGAPQPGGDSANRVVQTGSGISNVTGVAQSIQVAGDGVSAVNGAIVSVEVGPPRNSGSGSQSQGGGSSGSQSQTQLAQGGATLSANLDQNSMGVSVTVPGVGEIKQEVRGSAGRGAAGIVQSATVAGDFHRVQNALTLRIQMTRPDLAQGVNMRPAFANLRGIRLMGAF